MRLDWLYPELKRIDPRDRISALHKAKEGPFDAIELIGIGIALVLVVGLTRYSVTGMGLVARVGAALANFIVAIPLLLIFAGHVLRAPRAPGTSRIHSNQLAPES